MMRCGLNRSAISSATRRMNERETRPLRLRNLPQDVLLGVGRVESICLCCSAEKWETVRVLYHFDCSGIESAEWRHPVFPTADALPYTATARSSVPRVGRRWRRENCG